MYNRKKSIFMVLAATAITVAAYVFVDNLLPNNRMTSFVLPLLVFGLVVLVVSRQHQFKSMNSLLDEVNRLVEVIERHKVEGLRAYFVSVGLTDSYGSFNTLRESYTAMSMRIHINEWHVYTSGSARLNSREPISLITEHDRTFIVTNDSIERLQMPEYKITRYELSLLVNLLLDVVADFDELDAVSTRPDEYRE